MIVKNLPAADYHAHPSVSKSKLWTLWSRTPFHARYGETQETGSMRFGTAAHFAVLQPELFDALYIRGPEDRRGNRWKEAQAEATAAGKVCVTEDDYDNALRLRDALHKNPLIRKLTTGALFEQSAFGADDMTGLAIRCRPDLVNPALGIMADLKSTTNASPDEWRRAVTRYGFHVQEPHYRLGWRTAGGCPINGFLFLTVESKPPFAHAIYELQDQDGARGEAIHRLALNKWAACEKDNDWPAWGDKPIRLGLTDWDRKEIDQQTTEQQEIA